MHARIVRDFTCGTFAAQLPRSGRRVFPVMCAGHFCVRVFIARKVVFFVCIEESARVYKTRHNLTEQNK